MLFGLTSKTEAKDDVGFIQCIQFRVLRLRILLKGFLEFLGREPVGGDVTPRVQVPNT